MSVELGSLSGIIVPLATPLKARDALDGAGLEKLVEHVIAGGVRGIFILGTTGEGQSLSYRLRGEVMRRVGAQVKGRAALLVGVTDCAFEETVRMAGEAAEAGADAVVAAPPYAMPEGPEIVTYLRHLSAALALPLFLYNFPPLTQVTLSVETVRQAMEIEGIVGLKDSSGSMIFFQRLVGMLPKRPGFRLYTGPEQLLASAVLMGGHGGVCGGANLFPRLYVGLYEAARRGEVEKTRTLGVQISEATGALYGISGHPSGVIKAIKCGLRLLGICEDFVAEPFQRFGAAEEERVRVAMARLGGISLQP